MGRRTLSGELVVALVLLFPWPWRARHTQHRKKHKTKPKRITKRTVTPVNPGVAMRLVMRLELQIGEIPLRFSGISLFGPGAQALAKSLGSWLNGENLHPFATWKSRLGLY